MFFIVAVCFIQVFYTLSVVWQYGLGLGIWQQILCFHTIPVGSNIISPNVQVLFFKIYHTSK